MDYVGGYALALDMTDRGLQSKLKSKGLPWSLAKGFDTSCPISKFISTDEIADPTNVQLKLTVNGDVRQDGNTRDMIFTIPFLISWISERFKLESGDVILTGTPSGVGPVKAGDLVEASLVGVTKMEFKVEKN